MTHDSKPFIFPDMPGEAVAAVDQFLEAFYNCFQNHYFAQMHRWYHAHLMSARPTSVRHQYCRSKIHPSEEGRRTTAAKTPRSRSSMAHHRS
jgi:hypothetical protein